MVLKMATERQSINESVALIEESIDTSLNDITKDTNSIAVSFETITKVAKVVGYVTALYVGVRIVKAVLNK